MRTFDWKWQKLILRIKTFIDLCVWKIQDNVTSSEVWNDSSRFCLFLSIFQSVSLFRFILGRFPLRCFLFDCSYSLLDPVGKSKDFLSQKPPVLLAHSGSWASHCGQDNGMHWLAKGNLSTSCLEGRRVERECQLLLKLTSYLKEAEHKNEILSVRSQDCKCVLYLLKGATICTDKENINEIVNGQYGI